MSTATIKLYLAVGDSKRLRTGEISNWSGKAVAAPRTDLDKLLARDELKKPGVYILIGPDDHIYSVAWVETIDPRQMRKIQAARGKAVPAETKEAIYEIQLLRLPRWQRFID